VKEELETKLKNLAYFDDGGVRLRLEEGRAPTMAEIAIKVGMEKGLEIKHFFFSTEISVGEAKEKICSEFGIEKENVIKHRLWRVDDCEDPQFAIKREKCSFSVCHVYSGELLILRTNQEVSYEF
jgi:hypothetical protein